MEDEKRRKYIEAIKKKSIELRKGFQGTKEFDPIQDPENPIIYTGNLDSKILILARDLGKTEVEKEEILIGRSGQIVRTVMSDLGYNLPNDYVMMNIVPYKPYKNKVFSLDIRLPFFELMKYLIKLINPDTIISMGFEANEAIMGFETIPPILSYSRSNTGGFLHKALNKSEKEFKIIPTPHPSYFLHNGGINGSICRNLFINLIKYGLNGIPEDDLGPIRVGRKKYKKKRDKNKEKDTKKIAKKKDKIFKNKTNRSDKMPQEYIDLLVNDIKQLKEKGVKEYTLYQKWEEIQKLNLKKRDVKDVLEVKEKIYKSDNPECHLEIEPELIYCHGDRYWERQWRYLRIFTSSMSWTQSPGRVMKFIVADKNTGMYLGCISVASDFMAMRARDKYIGWTSEDRQKKKKLRNTLMGSTIVPVQPLGYNHLGGKLISLMVLSDPISEKWEEAYGDKLVGCTTTSLYGSFSQYTNLKYWKHVGHSTGSVLLTPSHDVWDKLRRHVKENWPKEYEACYYSKPVKKGQKKKGCNIKTGPKQHVINLILKNMGIKPSFLKHEFERGIYFARLYENTNEFLRGEIEEKDLKQRGDFSVEALAEIWRKKYASKRIKKLLKQDRCDNRQFFYDDIIGKTWEETKEMYLSDVGR